MGALEDVGGAPELLDGDCLIGSGSEVAAARGRCCCSAMAGLGSGGSSSSSSSSSSSGSASASAGDGGRGGVRVWVRFLRARCSAAHGLVLQAAAALLGREMVATRKGGEGWFACCM